MKNNKYKDVTHTVQQVGREMLLIKELYSWVYEADVVKA